ncbi:MAG TPA: hypothetical protein VKF36_15830 [Syntrophorhabdales bacterium]|nr:hypothetical protein [Syntrophorhabdales bacterium]
MGDDKDKGSLLPISTVAVMLAAFGVTMFVQPFKGSRPFVPEYRESYEKVDARLWQDPFQAVLDSLKAGAAGDGAGQVDIGNGGPKERRETRFTSAYLEKIEDTKKVEVLAVMVPGGPYFEDTEGRMRFRYALLSGLKRVGFVSDDALHVEFIKIASPDKKITLSNIIPIEWLEYEKDKKESVLVLWINDDTFEGTPLSKLAHLFDYIEKTKKLRRINVRFKVIGPAISGRLGEMVREVSDNKTAGWGKTLDGVKIYSPWATVDNARLLKEATGEMASDENDARAKIKNKFRNHKITLIRTIGTDAALVKELIEELKRRRVDLRSKKSHLLLVAEWDTFYGRSFKNLFNEALKETLKSDGVPDNKIDIDQRIHFISYLRGIDGSVPGEKGDQDKKDGNAQPKSDPLSDIKKLEQPVGKSQYDYLRRLAAATYELNENLRAKGDDEEIKAIGVMGSDFYDKYLVLQALRQQFPDAIFFTTDLDARFLHPDNIKWTRNVIVASNFNLSLRKDAVVDVQGEAPPFRDNYQTSVFLTVLRAFKDKWTSNLDEDVVKCLSQFADEERKGKALSPLIFEIGRHKAVCLTDPSDTVRPQREQTVVGIRSYVRTALVIALGLVVLFWTSTRINNYVKQLCHAEGKYKIVAVGGVLLLVVAFGYAVLRISNRADEEPFSVLEGISIWPAEILRFLAFLLSALFLYLSWSSREANRKLINEKLFRIKEEPDRPLQANDTNDKPGETKQGTRLRDLWLDYVSRDSDRHRVLRVIIILIFYVPLCGLIISFDPPVSPVRGGISPWIDLGVLSFSSFSLVVVIFYVFDVTRCCRRFITTASDNISALHQSGGDIRDQVKNQMTLVRLIAIRTDTVGKLIFYPFIVWFLMFASRFDYFDNWRTPPGLAVVIFLGAMYAWSSAFLLRQSAERARTCAVDRLKDLLLINLGDKKPSPDLTKHIEAALDEVRSMRQGAFAPFTQHPIVQSLLVPFGGVSGIYLVDFLAKMNF